MNDGRAFHERLQYSIYQTIVIHRSVLLIDEQNWLRPCVMVWIEAAPFDDVVAKVEHADFLASMSEKNTLFAGVVWMRAKRL
ncbi:hypothetical protein ANTPLA_LOCUS4558 [Anthophora plagiata]